MTDDKLAKSILLKAVEQTGRRSGKVYPQFTDRGELVWCVDGIALELSEEEKAFLLRNLRLSSSTVTEISAIIAEYLSEEQIDEIMREASSK